MFARALLVTAQTWKQRKAHQPVNRWANGGASTAHNAARQSQGRDCWPPRHPHGTRTATGMSLKSVMLSESSQTRTSTHCKFPFMSNSRKDKSNQEQQKADQWLPRSRGGWRWPGTGRAGTIQGARSVRSVVTATGTCALVDTRVVQLKLVRFILCKLYLNQGWCFKKGWSEL